MQIDVQCQSWHPYACAERTACTWYGLVMPSLSGVRDGPDTHGYGQTDIGWDANRGVCPQCSQGRRKRRVWMACGMEEAVRVIVIGSINRHRDGWIVVSVVSRSSFICVYLLPFCFAAGCMRSMFASTSNACVNGLYRTPNGRANELLSSCMLRLASLNDLAT